MIYKFKSKAAGDLIMLGPNGDALLRAMGRDPAPRGIIEPAAMAQAISDIEQVIAGDEAARAAAEAEAAAQGESLPPRAGVSPRQRFWPMIEMLRRAMAAGQPIVWGV
jgi:hypothetical protein